MLKLALALMLIPSSAEIVSEQVEILIATPDSSWTADHDRKSDVFRGYTLHDWTECLYKIRSDFLNHTGLVYEKAEAVLNYCQSHEARYAALTSLTFRSSTSPDARTKFSKELTLAIRGQFDRDLVSYFADYLP